MSTSRALLTVMIAFALVLTGCSSLSIAGPAETVEGSGTLASETRAVSGFTEIVLAGQGEIDIVFGDSEAMSIEAEDNLLPYLTTTVSGSRLTIGTKPNINLQPTRLIRYHVTLRQLTRVEISGSGNVDLPEVVGDRLEFEITGSGNLTAAGAVDELDATLSGSGNILTGDLQAIAVDVSLLGSGNLTVWATERLHIQVGGSGSVSYYGRPADLQQAITGSGSVIDLGDK
jgi:hypothetical protein